MVPSPVMGLLGTPTRRLTDYVFGIVLGEGMCGGGRGGECDHLGLPGLGGRPLLPNARSGGHVRSHLSPTFIINVASSTPCIVLRVEKVFSDRGLGKGSCSFPLARHLVRTMCY